MKISIDIYDFKRGMAACSKNVAVKHEAELRPVIGRVCIRVYDNYNGTGRLEMVGLNGFTMVCAYMLCGILEPNTENTDKDYYEFLIESVNIPRGAKSVTISDDEKFISIDFDGITFNQRKFDQEYVRYSLTMMPFPPVFQITVNPKYLEQVMHACKEEDNVTLSFYSEFKPIQVDGNNIRALCLPVRMKDDKKDERQNAMQDRKEAHK